MLDGRPRLNILGCLFENKLHNQGVLQLHTSYKQNKLPIILCTHYMYNSLVLHISALNIFALCKYIPKSWHISALSMSLAWPHNNDSEVPIWHETKLSSSFI